MQALKIVLISVCVTLIESSWFGTDEDEAKTCTNNAEILTFKKFPYVVIFKVYVEGNATLCTGTLLTEWFVLTVAHCTTGLQASNFTIYHGDLTGPGVQVEKVFQHELYVPYKNDLCILKLKDLSLNVKEFAKIYGDISDLGEKGLTCSIIGFSRCPTSTNKNKGQMNTVVLKSGLKACGIDVNSLETETLCLQLDKDICSCPYVASGGPVICNGILYGMTSHGIFKKGPDALCKSADTVINIQYIKKYKSWIDDKMDIITEESKRCRVYVHKKCFLMNLCKKEKAKRKTVGSPREVDTKECIDTRNVEVEKKRDTYVL
ncbi:mast cell protease 4-like [Sipha flava]|uniref:Mast cell protease 4-like n=1 Tax=Sipha flava TaxID=143950 RepID=A0A8B8FTV0_9HEMI|nr:mast cell protease 4-like [Sipha flava]